MNNYSYIHILVVDLHKNFPILILKSILLFKLN